METVAERFVPLAFLVLTAAGWYAAAKWLIAAVEQVRAESNRAREAAEKAKVEETAAEERMDKIAFAEAGRKLRDAEIADKVTQLQSVLLSRYFSIFWFGVFLTFLAALLSVMNVVIAIPLGLIAVLAVTSQFSAAMFSLYSSWYKQGHPAQILIRRVFGILIVLGIAYPVLLITISRIMLARQLL